MNKFNIQEVTKSCRQMNCNETLQLLKTQPFKVMSWGANNYTNIENKALKFKVQAHRHKGYIYITVNGNDLYDVYLVSTHNNLVKEFKDIFFEDLVNTIDTEIEYIKDYKDN